MKKKYGEQKKYEKNHTFQYLGYSISVNMNFWTSIFVVSDYECTVLQGHTWVSIKMMTHDS